MAEKSVLVPKELYDKIFLGVEDHDDNNERWLSAFSCRQRPSAGLFFDHFKRNNITINDKGELVKDHTTIEGSHVVDLIKDSLHHSKKEPKGVDIFLKWMTETHLPRSYIRDLKRRERDIDNNDWIEL